MIKVSVDCWEVNKCVLQNVKVFTYSFCVSINRNGRCSNVSFTFSNYTFNFLQYSLNCQNVLLGQPHTWPSCLVQCSSTTVPSLLSPVSPVQTTNGPTTFIKACPRGVRVCVEFYVPRLYNSLCFIYLLYYLLILLLFGHSMGVLTCLFWLNSAFICCVHVSADKLFVTFIKMVIHFWILVFLRLTVWIIVTIRVRVWIMKWGLGGERTKVFFWQHSNFSHPWTSWQACNEMCNEQRLTFDTNALQSSAEVKISSLYD